MYNKELAAGKLRKWASFLREYDLPKWEQLPYIDLYMDQLIILLTQYLELLPPDENEDKLITPSIINNYVRLKLIPPPEKKKYSRIHLAYLIMICTLKQSLNISNIQKILPSDLSAEDMKGLYDAFIDNYRCTAETFVERVRSDASAILDPADEDEHALNRLILNSAMNASFYSLLAKKLIAIEFCDRENETK